MFGTESQNIAFFTDDVCGNTFQINFGGNGFDESKKFCSILHYNYKYRTILVFFISVSVFHINLKEESLFFRLRINLVICLFVCLMQGVCAYR